MATITFQNDNLKFTRTPTLIGPFEAEIELSLSVFDSDTPKIAATNPVTFGGVSAGTGIAFTSLKFMRFGRMALMNAHGSELQDPPVPLLTQYYADPGWVTNISDSPDCTPVATGNLTLTPTPGGLSTTPDLAGATFLSSGSAPLKLIKTGAANTGYFKVDYDLSSLTYLRFDWDANGFHDNDPESRATFGIFKGNKMLIYMRELY